MSYENRTSVQPGVQVQANATSSAPAGHLHDSATSGDTVANLGGLGDETPSREHAQREQGSASPASAPAISNTGASTSLTSDDVTGGFDWLDVGVYGHWETEHWDRIRLKLELARTAAESVEDEQEDQLQIGEEWARVRPSGAKRGIYYRYVAEVEGITFYVRDRSGFDERNASVYVQIGSVPLMLYGGKQAWSMAVEMLKKWGFVEHFNIVSRVDFCVDLPGVDTDLVVKEIMAGACIRKARSWSNYGEGYRHTGYVCGKEIRMRIYDKLLEVKNDPLKLRVMIAQRWGGVLPEHATRVEFQLRRSKLKELYDVTTVDNLLKKMHYIVNDLAYNWFRMTDRPLTQSDRENNNHQRYEVSEFWMRVWQGFMRWVVLPDSAFVVPVKSVKANTKQLKLQALGCLAKMAAIAGKEFRSAVDAVAWLRRQVEAVGDQFAEATQQKKRELAFRYPSKLFIDESMIPY